MATSLDEAATSGLLEFHTEQSIFEDRGVRVGGRPGANPTVLIGSAFYHGHKVNVDEDTGEFDAEEAEKRIRAQDEFSELTGSPCLLDVGGATPQAIEKHLEFAAEVTQAPLLIDGTTVESASGRFGVRRQGGPGRPRRLQLDPAGHRRRGTHRDPPGGRPECDPAHLLPAGFHRQGARPSRARNAAAFAGGGH